MVQVSEHYVGFTRLMVNGLTEYYEALINDDYVDTTFFNFLIDTLIEEGADKDLLGDVNYILGLLVAYSNINRYLEEAND